MLSKNIVFCLAVEGFSLFWISNFELYSVMLVLFCVTDSGKVILEKKHSSTCYCEEYVLERFSVFLEIRSYLNITLLIIQNALHVTENVNSFTNA